MRNHRLAITLLVVVIGLLFATPGRVAAKNDRVIHFDYSYIIEDTTVCGITVDIAGSGTVQATIKNWVIGPSDPPATQFWLGQINEKASETYTDVATGETVIVGWVNIIHEASMVYVGDADGDGVDGDWAYTFANNGIVLRVDGKPFDVGRIIVTNILHLGDLSTDEDDYFVGLSTGFVAGPHPDTFEVITEGAFCGPFLAALAD